MVVSWSYSRKQSFDCGDVRYFFDIAKKKQRIPSLHIAFKNFVDPKPTIYGQRLWGAAYDTSFRGMRYFVVATDIKQNAEAALETLYHELTHVVQYATNRLRTGRYVWYWEGRAHLPPTTRRTYINAPWEIEARQLSEELAAERIFYHLEKEHHARSLFSPQV